jgi:hypothetical protein
MKAIFSKEILQEPQDLEKSYENYTLTKNSDFCCDKFKSYCKKFTVWDYNKGKFAIVDEISYDGHSTLAIDFCPFCGEKIEYQEKNNSKNPKK